MNNLISLILELNLTYFLQLLLQMLFWNHTEIPVFHHLVAPIPSAKKEAACPLVHACQTMSELLQTADLSVQSMRNVQLHKLAYNKNVGIHVKDLAVLRLYAQYRVTLQFARVQRDTLVMHLLCAG